MRSVSEMNTIFLPNNIIDHQSDFHQYFERNASNQGIINYEEEGSVMSAPMSLSSSPVATDNETRNCGHTHRKSSEIRDNGLHSIYEIRILYAAY
jgi:hypothetical protein